MNGKLDALRGGKDCWLHEERLKVVATIELPLEFLPSLSSAFKLERRGRALMGSPMCMGAFPQGGGHLGAFAPFDPPSILLEVIGLGS